MSLIYKTRSRLVEAYDIKCGNLVEIIPLRNGDIKIKKAKTDETTKKPDTYHKIKFVVEG